MPPIASAMRATTASRWLLALAVSCLVLGWGFFGAAAMTSSLYTVSHPMRGFEFVPGVIMMLGLLGVVLFPRRDHFEEYSAFMCAVNACLVWLLVWGIAGFLGGLGMIIGEWMVPPNHWTRPRPEAIPAAAAVVVVAETGDRQPQRRRGLFSSPTPTPTKTPSVSPRPRRVSVHTQSDFLTGGLLCGQLAMLVLALAFFWGWAILPYAPGTGIDSSSALDDY